MGFWSGEKLAERLEGLIEDFDPARIDCAAYPLRVGREVFVSSADTDDHPKSRIKLPLTPGEAFRIPPGQFAFLVAEEKVKVPNDAIGFISMKTTQKFKGLVNVSGFHVDPGWDGYLKFGVYNAGSESVHLHRGQDVYLIWYASLDRPTAEKFLYKNNHKRGDSGIPEDYLMSGDVFSPMRLKGDMEGLRSELSNLKASLSVVITLALGLVVGVWLLVIPMSCSPDGNATQAESPNEVVSPDASEPNGPQDQ